MSWSQAVLVGMFVGCVLVQGNESTGCFNSIGTSREGIEQLGLHCYDWGIHIEVETRVTPERFSITSLSYRCTNSSGILVQNALLESGGKVFKGSWNETYSFPSGTTCTLFGCYENQNGWDEVYDLESMTCTIPDIASTTGTQLPEVTLPPHPTPEGRGSTFMSEVSEGIYVSTTAESMGYHTTWRSESTSQSLATMETAALPFNTPLPTLLTTVAIGTHSIPTASVLPTLELHHSIGTTAGPGTQLPEETPSYHPSTTGAISGGKTAAITLVVVVAAAVILTSIMTICIIILRHNYKRSSNAHKIYREDFLGDIDLTFKPVEVNPNHKLSRGESLHSILYTLEKEPKVPIQTTPQEPNSDDSDETSEILSTCEPTTEDVSCRSVFTEEKKYPNDKHQDFSVGTKKASTLFSSSPYVYGKYTRSNASQSTGSDHTFEMSYSSASENFEQTPVLPSPTSMRCQEPLAQNDGYVQDTDAERAILRSTNAPQLNTQPTSTAQPNGYICDTHVLQQNSSYSPCLTMDPPFPHVHNEISTPAVQASGYCSDQLASPQSSSTAPNPKCESDSLLFCTEYDETFTSIPSKMQLKTAVMSNQPIEHCSDPYITEDHVPHYDTNIQNGNQLQELNPNNQLALPHIDKPYQPTSEYIQNPLSQSDPFQTENNEEDFIWYFDSANMSEGTSEMTKSSPGQRTGSQKFCVDPQSTQEYVPSKPQNDGVLNQPALEASGKQNRSDIFPALSTLAVSEKQLDGDVPVPFANRTSTEVPVPFLISSDGNTEVSTGTYISHTPVERGTFQAGSECYQEEELPWLDSSMLEKHLQSSHQNPMLYYSDSSTTEHQEISASTDANLGYSSRSAVQSTGYMDFPAFSLQPEVHLASDGPHEEEYLIQSADYSCVNEGVSFSQHKASHYHPTMNNTDQQALTMSQSQTATRQHVKHYTPLVLPSLLSATSQQNHPSGSTVNSNEDETSCLLWLEDDASLEQTPNLPFSQSTNVHPASSYTGMEEMKLPVYPTPSILPHMQASLSSERREARECQQNTTIEQYSIELDIPEDFIVEDEPISQAQGVTCSGSRSSDYVDGAYTLFEGLREELLPSNVWKANRSTSDYI